MKQIKKTLFVILLLIISLFITACETTDTATFIKPAEMEGDLAELADMITGSTGTGVSTGNHFGRFFEYQTDQGALKFTLKQKNGDKWKIIEEQDIEVNPSGYIFIQGALDKGIKIYVKPVYVEENGCGYTGDDSIQFKKIKTVDKGNAVFDSISLDNNDCNLMLYPSTNNVSYDNDGKIEALNKEYVISVSKAESIYGEWEQYGYLKKDNNEIKTLEEIGKDKGTKISGAKLIVKRDQTIDNGIKSVPGAKFGKIHKVGNRFERVIKVKKMADGKPLKKPLHITEIYRIKGKYLYFEEKYDDSSYDAGDTAVFKKAHTTI